MVSDLAKGFWSKFLFYFIFFGNKEGLDIECEYALGCASEPGMGRVGEFRAGSLWPVRAG